MTKKKKKNNLKNILKKKPVAIFLTAVLLLAFTLFTIKMVGNISSQQTRVKLETNYGDIVIQLYDDMPITTSNFKNLVESGTYDGTIFHRVIDGFMIQGGDPTGSGYGDSKIPTIQDEFVEGHSNIRGTIAMANTGRPNSGSSQFFINLVDNSFLDFNKQPLSSKHPVFGEIVEGMDVVDKIAKVKTDGNPPIGNNKPLEEVKIIKATVL